MKESARQAKVWSDKVESSKRGAADKGYVGHKAAKMMKRSKNAEARKERAAEEKSKLLNNAEYAEMLKITPLMYHSEKLVSFSDVGDSYFSAFLCSLLETSKEGKIVEGTDEEMAKRLQTAMGKGAVFAAKVCALEGAFGYGVPILGKTTV